MEMVAAVTVSLVGFIGMLDLQTASIQSLTDSRAMFQAMQLSEHFGETLRVEAIEWTNGSTQSTYQTKFQYLKYAPSPAVTNATSNWLVATPSGFVGPLANSTYDTGIQSEFPAGRDTKFCIHYRWTWLIANDLIRADVRIMWPRPNAEREIYTNCNIVMASDVGNINSLTVPVMIMRNQTTTL
jgi:hypothetical protein